jgi:ankyrin repeat protein
MRRAVVAVPLVALAAYGGGGSDPGRPEDRRPSDLVSAAARGDVGSVRRLLADGAPVDTRDRDRRTAVTAAALGDHVAVARTLIDAGADVDLQDAERNNPLLVCGVTGNVAMLREVLRAHPNVRLTNRFGGTALIPASERGHVEMVRALLETDIDVDHVNRLGWTALLEAVILGDGGPAHRQIVQLLVDAGADLGIADRDGVTALEHARERGYDEIAQTLEDAGGAAVA